MKPDRPPRARRPVVRGIVLAALVLGLTTAWACPRAGRYLIVDTVTGPADAIVVLAGTRAERWLEAVDLYKEKLAPSILLSGGRIEAAEAGLRQRGIRFPRDADLVRDAMIQLGIPAAAVETFPESVDNTAAEASATRAIATERGWRRLIVVTSKYHTRRSLYAFQRAFRGTGVTIEVRGTRHEESHPDEWWRHRRDVRFVIAEVEKLVAYRLGLRD